MHGDGGACMTGDGVHGRQGGMHGRGACVLRGGKRGRGCAWQGGMCDGGHVC